MDKIDKFWYPVLIPLSATGGILQAATGNYQAGIAWLCCVLWIGVSYEQSRVNEILTETIDHYREFTNMMAEATGVDGRV